MDSDLQQKLYAEYPEIFSQKDLPMTQTAMCWGIATGDGWYEILNNVCFLIQQRVKSPHETIELYEKWISEENDEDRIIYLREKIEKEKEKISSVQFVQVKEKFGTLRIYHTGEGDDPYIDGVISMAESMSGVTCEQCGNKGTLSTKGWHHTLCDRCRVIRFSREIP